MKVVIGVSAALLVLVSTICSGKTVAPASTEQKASFIGHLSTLIERAYLYPDKGARLAQELRDHQAAGRFDAYADADSFAQALTEWLRKSSGDLHFNIKASPAEHPDGAATAFLDARRSSMESLRSEFNGFKQASNLGDGVGYLSYAVFRDPGRSDLEAALQLLRHADAIVLDLRGHRGGTEEMTNALLSHFLPPGTHLSDTYGREGLVSHDYTTELQVGAIRIEAPLFVLVDGRTASGAEAAAFFLKRQGRATIAGSTTMGAAHSGGTWTIDGFSVFIPNERHVDPKTGQSWEGSGVVPDIVISEGDAMPGTLALAKSAAAKYGASRCRSQHALLERLRQEADASPADGADPQWAATRADIAGAIAAGILDEGSVNDLGYLFLGQKRFGAALAVLAGNAALHPQSPNAHDSLAEAFEGAGRLDDALAHYTKAVELAVAARSPNLEQHRVGLERVRKKLEERH